VLSSSTGTPLEILHAERYIGPKLPILAASLKVLRGEVSAINHPPNFSQAVVSRLLVCSLPRLWERSPAPLLFSCTHQRSLTAGPSHCGAVSLRHPSVPLCHDSKLSSHGFGRAWWQGRQTSAIQQPASVRSHHVTLSLHSKVLPLQK